ncbi:hypothetical protein MIR68_011089 [Amoeboaphelidium protococcarum]|nr:hypothetical protein MIR68_011089 [Amoeboaphelidium protococcarum]
MSQQAAATVSTPATPTSSRISDSGIKIGNYCVLEKAQHYELWCKKMETLLVCMDLWDDKLNQPIDTKETKFAMESNISMDILQNHIDCQSASEYWSALKKTFAPKCIANKVDFVKKIAKFEFGEDVQGDFMRAKALVRGLTAAMGEKHIAVQDLMLMILIAALPEHLRPIRAVITAGEKLCAWDALESRCVQEDATSSPSSLKSFKTRTHRGKCFGKSCYICDPSLRPTCSKCKEAKMEKYFHKEDSDFCLKQQNKANVAE